MTSSPYSISRIEGVTSNLNELSAAELLSNLREKIHQTKFLQKSNVEIEEILVNGKSDDDGSNESKSLDEDDKMVLKEALEENKEAIQRKIEASQILSEILTQKIEAQNMNKDLQLDIQTILQEFQGSGTEQGQIDSSVSENHGLFM